MIRQEMAWFDDPLNGVGALSTRLTSDASDVQEAFGYPLCSFIQCVTAFIVGLSMAYSYNWKLATICTIPAIITGGLILFESK